MNNKKYHIFRMKLNTLNILSIILLILMILLTYFITTIFNIKINFNINNKDITIIFITYIFYIILHELLHGISYIIHGANPKNITFGSYIEKGILCCLCKQNITKKNILNSLLYPFFWIGIITYILGFLIKSKLLIILSILNISGCVGDLIMFIYFIKLKNIEYSEFDDPISFALYTNQDLTKDKPFALKYIKTTNNLPRKDLKKITISKTSYIILLTMTLLTGILLFI